MSISVNKPCHEDWTKMTANEQGAFCGVCTKNVVDFTAKTLEEIKSFFEKPREGRVCGRFREAQLQELSVESFLERFMGMQLARRIAMVVAMTLVSWLAGGNMVNAQNQTVLTGKVSAEHVRPPETVTTQTVVPVKMGIVAAPKDTTKCTKDPKTGQTADPGQTPKKKTKTSNMGTHPEAISPKEKHIMGDVKE